MNFEQNDSRCDQKILSLKYSKVLNNFIFFLGGELPLEIKRIAKDREVDLVEFAPEAAGNYKFVILYGGEQVPGSPVNFMVEDRRSNELRVYGEGLSSGQIHEEIIFFIEGKQLGTYDFT